MTEYPECVRKSAVIRAVVLVLGLVSLVLSPGCESRDARQSVELWTMSTEIRPASGSYRLSTDSLQLNLTGLAGEYLSAQVLVKSGREIKELRCVAGALADGVGRQIGTEQIRVRYAGCVPVDETMTLTAEPLLELERVDVPANVAQSVWITIKVPRDFSPGTYGGELVVNDYSGQLGALELNVEVLPASLPEPWDWSFYLNIWQNPSGIARAHNVEHWSEEHWRLLEKYARNAAAHGQDAITTATFHDHWAGNGGYVYESMIEWQFFGEEYAEPGGGKLSWDFSVFDRYVALMIEAGVKSKIDCFSLVKGPGANKNSDLPIVNLANNQPYVIRATLGDPMWRHAWSAFLLEFREHLKEKGWFELAYIAFDEKPEEDMRLIYDFLLETVPDFKVSVAGGYPGTQSKQTDELIVYVDDMGSEDAWAAQAPLINKMRSEGRLVSFYTACRPSYPNTFLYSRLKESRMLPWFAWKYNLNGYLRWAFCSYPEDVWNQPAYKWHAGDMFFVYPGPDGPLDGMRWELLRQGIQDYEALKIATGLCRQKGRDDLLGPLEEAVSYATTVETCRFNMVVGDAREKINDVIRQLGE